MGDCDGGGDTSAGSPLRCSCPACCSVRRELAMGAAPFPYHHWDGAVRGGLPGRACARARRATPPLVLDAMMPCNFGPSHCRTLQLRSARLPPTFCWLAARQQATRPRACVVRGRVQAVLRDGAPPQRRRPAASLRRGATTPATPTGAQTTTTNRSDRTRVVDPLETQAVLQECHAMALAKHLVARGACVGASDAERLWCDVSALLTSSPATAWPCGSRGTVSRSVLWMIACKGWHSCTSTLPPASTYRTARTARAS